MKTFITLFAIILSLNIYGQNKPAYILYSGSGKKVTYKKMIKKIEGTDLVLFGELHNSAISHWLQLALIKDMYTKRKLILGAEMFEADNQEDLNKYINGEIKQKGLDSLARLWPNYKTDYAPLVNFAKDSHLVFVATNIPRKYANLVFKRDFSSLDSLTDIEKSYMAPLPIEYDSTLPGYVNIVKMMGGHGGNGLPKAQASKDATMAHFILKNYKQNALFIHFNGAYHSDNFEGILWYIKRQNPIIKYITITTVTQADISSLEKENFGKADYIICVDEDVTTTY